MRTPHLLPAAAALLLAGAALAGWFQYARRVERRAVHALAAEDVPGVARYRALRAEVFRQPDLLQVYGSCEVVFPDPYHMRELFRRRPSGFTPFPVGELAGGCLLDLQELAAVGSQLRGKRVVLSFTPGNFREKPGRVDGYLANFSRLDANELAFSPGLSMAVRRAGARRMLEYPESLNDDPLLRFALERLAHRSRAGDLLYRAALPLGRLQTWVLRLLDHRETLALIHDRLQPPPPTEEAAAFASQDWGALAEQAERAYRPHARNNPFGFEDQLWTQRLHNWVRPAPPCSRDAEFRWGLDHAREWDDLAVLLRALRELGARPLLLSTPQHGTYLDYNGVSRSARQEYYDRLRALASAHGVPLVDFAEHDGDRFFLVDTVRLSSKGWVYYDYALDAFYHGRPRLELAPGR